MKKRLELKGVIPAIILPLNRDYSIDEQGFHRRAAAHESLAKAEKPLAPQWIAFGIGPVFFYGSPPTCAARSRYSAGRPGNAAPVPLVSDRDGPPHDRVTAPNPACGAGEGQDAGTSGRQA